MNTDLSVRIKTKVIELGFQKVGITPAVLTPKEKADLESWLGKKHNGTMAWMETRKEERGDIFNYFPGAKSIISVGLNYFTDHDQNDLSSELKDRKSVV